MIDVKEAKEANEGATSKGWNDPFAFRDPAEMVTISAGRFEMLIRTSEIQKNEINHLREKIGKAWGFINTVAMEWAERGNTIPTYEDLSRMAQILDWREPDGIRRMRERVAAEKEAAKKEKEGANNGEATD